MRLLMLQIDEPLAGRVLLKMAAECGEEEAARRYRAIAVTTLRQLRGLSDARLRLVASPGDAAEAIRFWLLPRLADRWHAEAGVFRTDGWEVDFGGETGGYQVVAEGEILCPFLSARWAHAAMLGLERGAHRVLGPAQKGGAYFRAEAGGAGEPRPEQRLPELPVIDLHEDWLEALRSPLGPALKRAWEEEG
jgi:glycosyltransferase A (GT-A) superfamily protein (DUF2064 family)